MRSNPLGNRPSVYVPAAGAQVSILGVNVGLRMVNNDQPSIPPHPARKTDLPICHRIHRCSRWLKVIFRSVVAVRGIQFISSGVQNFVNFSVLYGSASSMGKRNGGVSSCANLSASDRFAYGCMGQGPVLWAQPVKYNTIPTSKKNFESMCLVFIRTPILIYS